MRCKICKRTSNEIKLFEGIYDAEMIKICNECAETEGIPIIKKPSESQLKKANERYSVRERMERMSGFRDATEISDDQMTTQSNLARLRIPQKKQYHENVLDNYYWILNIARRRAKFSIKQLAEKMQVDPQTIQKIEKGKLPENFEDTFLKLELFLGIKLLKNHTTKINFTRTKNEEQEILNSVQAKMDSSTSKDNKKDITEFKDNLSKGKANLSKRENLQNVTLNDLVEMKKEKEKRKIKTKEETILGDDIEIEEL